MVTDICSLGPVKFRLLVQMSNEDYPTECIDVLTTFNCPVQGPDPFHRRVIMSFIGELEPMFQVVIPREQNICQALGFEARKPRLSLVAGLSATTPLRPKKLYLRPKKLCQKPKKLYRKPKSLYLKPTHIS